MGPRLVPERNPSLRPRGFPVGRRPSAKQDLPDEARERTIHILACGGAHYGPRRIQASSQSWHTLQGLSPSQPIGLVHEDARLGFRDRVPGYLDPEGHVPYRLSASRVAGHEDAVGPVKVDVVQHGEESRMARRVPEFEIYEYALPAVAEVSSESLSIDASPIGSVIPSFMSPKDVPGREACLPHARIPYQTELDAHTRRIRALGGRGEESQPGRLWTGP